MVSNNLYSDLEKGVERGFLKGCTMTEDKNKGKVKVKKEVKELELWGATKVARYLEVDPEIFSRLVKKGRLVLVEGDKNAGFCE